MGWEANSRLHQLSDSKAKKNNVGFLPADFTSDLAVLPLMLPSLCWEIVDVGTLSDFTLLEESEVMLEVGVEGLEAGFLKVVAQGLAHGWTPQHE